MARLWHGQIDKHWVRNAGVELTHCHRFLFIEHLHTDVWYWYGIYVRIMSLCLSVYSMMVLCWNDHRASYTIWHYTLLSPNAVTKFQQNPKGVFRLKPPFITETARDRSSHLPDQSVSLSMTLSDLESAGCKDPFLSLYNAHIVRTTAIRRPYLYACLWYSAEPLFPSQSRSQFLKTHMYAPTSAHTLWPTANFDPQRTNSAH